ncbi:hypothetical protein [Pseudobythopirellula maris]|nr:hypothetical protein [Pseudobythopirellula maris]
MLAALGTCLPAHAAEAAPAASSDSGTMVDTPAFKLGWPEIKMPKLNWKPGWGGEADPTKPAAANPFTTAVERVSTASQQAMAGARNGWNQAFDKLRTTSTDAAPRSKEPEGPGFWARLFTPPEEPQQARTVSEFIAQDRPGTYR